LAAGFEGFRSNHSLRASAASRLYQQGFDEQLICETTGHRSNAVRGYKRTTAAQKLDISNAISGSNGGEKRARIGPSETITRPQEADSTISNPSESTSVPSVMDSSGTSRSVQVTVTVKLD